MSFNTIMSKNLFCLIMNKVNMPVTRLFNPYYKKGITKKLECEIT